MSSTTPSEGLMLVLGGTGKTGRRVAERLASRGVSTCVASRAGDPPFDGVRRALGREPGDFAEYVHRTAATGVWDVPS